MNYALTIHPTGAGSKYFGGIGRAQNYSGARFQVVQVDERCDGGNGVEYVRGTRIADFAIRP